MPISIYMALVGIGIAGMAAVTLIKVLRMVTAQNTDKLGVASARYKTFQAKGV